MSVHEAAKLYISLGWKVVPLAPGQKQCINEPEWKKLIFKPEDFGPKDNIGIKQGEGLVDIDLDAPEAVACADDFLPLTGAIYGRASKPRSHRLYRTTIDKPVKHQDLITADKKKASLVEIRVDHQSMAPPSLHPEGELVEWADGSLETAEVAPETLHRLVNLVATTAMVIRYYNPPGARHDWMLALAGFMRNLGITEGEADQVIKAASRVSKDANAPDRLKEVHDTYAKGDDEPLKATKALEEGMHDGVKFISSIRKIWGADPSGLSRSKMAELNDKHAVIFQQSGDLVVITEDMDVDQRPFLRFSAPDTMRQLYPQLVPVGVTARGQPIMKPLGTAWLNSPKRRFYNGIELAPNGRATPNYYNMWRGFSVKPVPGSWRLFKEHIYSVICNQDKKIFEYVIAWCANAVQKPGHQANTAIALRGGQGTGKGAFVRGFGALFGVHFVHLDSTRHLTGNFNAHLHNAILVFADEAAWPGDKAGLGALKRIITEPTLSIERKGMDIMSVPNMVHLLLASNEEWVVPAAIDERRFVVLDVAKDKQNDTRYFGALNDELANGGLAAMLHDLLEYKYELDLRIIPKTDALYEQKRLTSGIQRRWWHQIITEGDFWKNEVPGARGVFRIERSALYDNYAQTLDRVGQRMKSLQTEVGSFLKKVMPPPYPQDYRLRGPNGDWLAREWLFPSLKICRDFYDKEYGITSEALWPAEEQLTEDPRLDM